MDLIVKKSYDEANQYVAEVIIEEVKNNPNLVLGLPSGATVRGLYETLVRDHQENGTDYSGVTTFNLGEYVGLLKEDFYRTHTYYMDEYLFKHIRFKHSYVPKYNTNHPQERAEKYGALYNECVPEVMVLGLGTNGHIGFNEPGTPADSTTRLVRLAESTRVANAKYFASLDDVPTHAITLGLQDIMKAKKIYLIATGETKAEIVKKVMDSEVTADIPATILKNHPNVTVVLDAEASSML